MTQQVLYSTATAQVLQWQDTEKFNYADPPSGTDTLAVTAEEWANQSGVWYVENGALTQTYPYAPTAAELLAQAQAEQKGVVTQGYNAAITATISFTDSAGVTDTYQADSVSQQYLQRAVTGYRISGTVPSGFYWRSATNHNNAFTLADLEGLYGSMLARAEEAYQQLQSLKAEIAAAGTVSAVQAIVWP